MVRIRGDEQTQLGGFAGRIRGDGPVAPPREGFGPSGRHSRGWLEAPRVPPWAGFPRPFRPAGANRQDMRFPLPRISPKCKECVNATNEAKLE
jgi:hypothetical protein